MKRLLAVTTLAGVLAVGCSSSNTGGTADRTTSTWGTGSSETSTTKPVPGTTSDDEWDTHQSDNQMQRETDMLQNKSKSEDSSGAATTPGGTDAGRDSSTGRNYNDSNTNNVDQVPPRSSDLQSEPEQ